MKRAQDLLLNESVNLPREEWQRKVKVNRRKTICIWILSLLCLGFLIGLIVVAVIIGSTQASASSKSTQLESCNQDIDAYKDRETQNNKTIDDLKDQIEKLKEQINDMKKQQQRLLNNKELMLSNLSMQTVQLTTKPKNFSNDVAPTIKKLDLSFNAITNFTGNALPDLQLLNLSSNPSLLKFQDNSFPSLTQLSFDTSSLTGFDRNVLSNLTGFLSVKAITFDSNQMDAITKLELVAKTLQVKFTGNKLESLVSLKAQVYSNNSFQNNYMPNLTSLVLTDSMPQRNQLTTLSNNNTMSYLTYLRVEHASLNSLNEIMTGYTLLEQAELSYNKFDTAAGLNHSNLKSLALVNSSIRGSFTKNNFTQLVNLSMSNNLDLQVFSNNTLPKLRFLNLSGCGFSSFDASQQVLETLVLDDNLNLKELSISSDKLRELYLANTMIDTFSGYVLLNLEKLSLAGSSLKTLNCSSLVRVTQLNLCTDWHKQAMTKLNDTIVGILVACNFQNLVRLDLTNNNDIINKDGAVRTLKQKYPVAYITV